MREITIKRKLYTYNELSEKAKEAVKQDYLNSDSREEDVDDTIKMYLSDIFDSPVASFAMEVEKSYFTQGSGVNIHGKIPVESLIRKIYKEAYLGEANEKKNPLPRYHSACFSMVKDLMGQLDIQSADDCIDKTTKALSYDLILTVPSHDRGSYSYSLADRAYFADKNYPYYELPVEDASEFEGADMKVLTALLPHLQDAMKALDNDIYSITEGMYLTISDEEMEELTDGDEFFFDGTYHVPEEDPDAEMEDPEEEEERE